MKRPTALALLAAAIGLAGTQAGYAQTSRDPRVVDLLQSGKLRAGLGIGSPSGAMKNPVTGEYYGVAVDLARALAARIGVDFVAIEYPRPGAIIEGAQTNPSDVAFVVIDPERSKQVDFSTRHTETAPLRVV